MPDKTDLKAKLESQSDDLIESVMEALVDKAVAMLEHDKTGERESPNRLIQLDECHYFDTQDRVVLQKDGSQLKDIHCDPVYLRRAGERIREEAQKHGYIPIESGSFFNPKTKHLYVINGERYVLYALDRRKSVRKRRVGDAAPDR